MAYLTRRSARLVLRASVGAAWGAGRVNSPRVIGGRDHEARDALVSGTATSRGYLGETGQEAGSRPGAGQDGQGARDRASMRTRAKTNANPNSGPTRACLNR